MIYLGKEEKSREQWEELSSDGRKAQCLILVLCCLEEMSIDGGRGGEVGGGRREGQAGLDQIPQVHPMRCQFRCGGAVLPLSECLVNVESTRCFTWRTFWSLAYSKHNVITKRGL